MFTRRHPFLFFFMVMSGIGVVALAMLSFLVMRISEDDHTAFEGEKIGVIEIVGELEDSQPILHQLKAFREEEAVKAIVIRIDSPGGGVGPAQEIYREIRKTIPEKKVVASMGAVAASGGYYVAAAADGIVASPGTITGSIGVVMGYANFEELMRKLGISSVVVKSGEFKDIGSPARAITPQEKQLLETVTLKIHKQFVAAIAEGRHLEFSRVDGLADGRILTGEDAQELGLVDRLGNFEDAVQWASEMAGLDGPVDVVYPPEEEDLFFLRKLISSALKLLPAGALQSTPRAESRLR